MNNVTASGVFGNSPLGNWQRTEMVDFLERCDNPHHRRSKLGIISLMVFEPGVVG